MIRVMVADDHPVVRLGFRALVEAEPDMTFVGEAEDAPEAVRRVVELRPDIVVLDLQMPGMSGAEAASTIVGRTPETRCLILAEQPQDVDFMQCPDGVAYVAMHSAGSELVDAIRALCGHNQVPSVAPRQFSDRVPTAANDTSLDWLSKRERQVAVMLARGMTAREIGDAIHLSHKTIGTYRGRIYHKLGVRTRAEITQAVMRAGWLALDKSA